MLMGGLSFSHSKFKIFLEAPRESVHTYNLNCLLYYIKKVTEKMDVVSPSKIAMLSIFK